MDAETASPQASLGVKAEPSNDVEGRSSALLRIRSYAKRLCSVMVEQNGIERYDPESRRAEPRPSVLTIFGFWFTLNLSTLNMTIGMLGPRQFSLTLHEAMFLAALAITAGSIPVGLVACLGPKSGLRTAVINRFVIGWYPAKVVGLLNMLMIMGYATLDVIAAGNLMSALAPDLPLASTVAVVTLGVLALAVAVIGSHALHFLERGAWLPQLIALFCLLTVFVLDSPNIGRTAARPLLDRLVSHFGFFSLVFSSVVTYSSVAADFFAHYPDDTPPWRLVFGSIGGLWLSYGLCIAIGIALGCGCERNPVWRDAYQTAPATLIVAVLKPMGVLGDICAVVLTFGNLSAASAGIYAQALAGQNVSTLLSRAPRVVWTIVTGFVVLACAFAAQRSFATYLQSFVSVVGYLTAVWLAVFVVEYCLIRTGNYIWSQWKEKRVMPAGIASGAALSVGMTVALLSMAQSWVVGPVAGLLGAHGIDLGNFTGPAAAVIAYVPLRYIEGRLHGKM